MSLVECYKCAILSVLRDETLDAEQKARVLDVLMRDKSREVYLTRHMGEKQEETC